MKYGLPNFPTIILFSIAIVCWNSVCFAFDDDSTDHSRSPFALSEICENGRVVQDKGNRFVGRQRTRCERLFHDDRDPATVRLGHDRFE